MTVVSLIDNICW